MADWRAAGIRADRDEIELGRAAATRVLPAPLWRQSGGIVDGSGQTSPPLMASSIPTGTANDGLNSAIEDDLISRELLMTAGSPAYLTVTSVGLPADPVCRRHFPATSIV